MAFYVGIFVGLAIVVVAIVGALKLWTWAFYAILALLGLEALWLMLGVLWTIAISLLSSAVIGQPAGPPAWMVLAYLGFGIPSAALFVWMVIARAGRARRR